MSAVTGWPGFKYQPVLEIQYQLAARQLRTARKNIQQVLATMGLKYSDLAERLTALRRNPRLNAAQKRGQFQRILDDYSARITAPAHPLAEAAPEVVGGTVALPDSGVVLESSPLRGDGDGPDDSGRVPELEMADIER